MGKSIMCHGHSSSIDNGKANHWAKFGPLHHVTSCCGHVLMYHMQSQVDIKQQEDRQNR